MGRKLSPAAICQTGEPFNDPLVLLLGLGQRDGGEIPLGDGARGMLCRMYLGSDSEFESTFTHMVSDLLANLSATISPVMNGRLDAALAQILEPIIECYEHYDATMARVGEMVTSFVEMHEKAATAVAQYERRCDPSVSVPAAVYRSPSPVHDEPILTPPQPTGLTLSSQHPGPDVAHHRHLELVSDGQARDPNRETLLMALRAVSQLCHEGLTGQADPEEVAVTAAGVLTMFTTAGVQWLAETGVLTEHLFGLVAAGVVTAKGTTESGEAVSWTFMAPLPDGVRALRPRPET